MRIDRPAIRRYVLPLAMLAVGLCLIVAGIIETATLLIPGALYIFMGLRGLRVQRARGAQNNGGQADVKGARRSNA